MMPNFLNAVCTTFLLTLWKHPENHQCPSVVIEAQPRQEYNISQYTRRWSKEIKGADANKGFDIVFYGDHTVEQFLGTQGGVGCGECSEIATAFQQQFGQYRSGVFGFDGEQAGHLLWQLEQGTLPFIHQPKVVVLSLGTAELTAAAACVTAGNERVITEAAVGTTKRLAAIISLLREQLPDSQLVLMGLLPRADEDFAALADESSPADGNLAEAVSPTWPSRYTTSLRLMNHWLECKAAEDDMITYLDCWQGFLRNGKMVPENHRDGMRLSARGAEMWAKCISQHVARLMPGESPLPESMGAAVQSRQGGHFWGLFKIQATKSRKARL